MLKFIEPFESKVIKDEKGFTLIEVMFALALLSIGLLGLSMMQIMGIQNTTLGYASTQAHHLAEQHMEMIINTDYNAQGISDISNNNGNLYSITETDHFNTDAQGNDLDLEKYNLIINVANNTPILNSKTIVVIVTWDNDRRIRKLSCIKTLTS
ncbi:MAG: prepilin-type N-terminal cleavage/methylation domain-containing protein [Deltaproteobacteria bacterium]|nr:prepilin-type N-terminal cleavage/methylation domain-containing protein [Deltaproteobacteria bacterium]MBW2218214.1 prepilin-type N-terminal cleavage/methylation domain-containing protein [Deltaproteobacteria bacterium]